jgi:hypothetical protein
MLTPEIEGRMVLEDRVKGKSICGRVVVFGVVVVCVVCGFGWAETHTYIFDPCQSTVLERNWAWGYTEEWYSIEGEFQFTFDLNDPDPGAAWFDWVDANLSEEISYWEGGYQTTESLDILFHMTDLNSTAKDSNGIDLVYEKNNPTFPQADVNVHVEFVGDSLHLTGTFWDDAYDGDRYDMNAVAVLKKYGGGLGDGNYPYLIYDANQMNAIGANPNDWDKHFKLCADINLSAYTGTSFNIIGGSSPYFSGVFDGNDYQITAFTYIDKTQPRVGLFGRTTESSEIRNVRLVDVNLCGYYDVGSVVGKNYGKVKSCSVTGVITGQEDVGGLIGENGYGAGVIQRCSTNVKMQNYGPQSYVGCLVGFNQSESEIIDCSSEGIVDGNDNTDKAGGLVGSNHGRIKRCYSTADVKGSWVIGGLIGAHDQNDLENCYATGDVSAEVRGGGLVGFSTHTIMNCYATGDVNCTRAAGGLIGEEGYGGAINCYSSGHVNGSQDVGGLVGYSNGGTLASCFWDGDVNPDVNGIGNATDPNVIGETTANMQMESTYTDASWDFVGEVINGPNDIWEICERTNYPKFVWQIPVGDLVCPDGVTLVDFSVLGAAWYSEPNDGNWDPNCDISEPNDNLIDERDLSVFTENYLTGF